MGLQQLHPLRKILLSLSLLLLVAGAAFIIRRTAARPADLPALQAAPLHPVFALLDENSQNVLDTGKPVSTMNTCGECHDTDFIASHSFHADLGLSDFTAPGQVNNGLAWDTSPGLFGKWDPLTYRYLSNAGDGRFDLGTADWLMAFGSRVVGGGPAVTSRSGIPLQAVNPIPGDPDISNWDWKQSGRMEMNCFLCHIPDPNNTARIQSIQAGQFGWANTATLLGTGLVEKAGNGWRWNPSAFDEQGELTQEFITIQDPTNANCAQCHGVVQTDLEEPLVITDCSLDDWQTATTGQVVSPQKIANSGLNLSGKDELARAWDIHAERGLECTDCHFSLNNPAYYQESANSRPDYLQYDPRRLDISEYLKMPDHNFARGQSAQYTIAPELKATMRRCEACHNAVDTHDWLPYTEKHMAELACESCHIPQLYAPALQSYDWTVLTADGQPSSECRGMEGSTGTLSDLVTGFTPVLISRQNVDGETLLAPYNLVAAWYWVYEDVAGSRPVRLADLQSAWFENGGYAPAVLQAFDKDGNASLEASELVIDSTEKQQVIAARLGSLGLKNPRIVGEVQPYSINHNVASDEWAIKDCKSCHNDSSRITQPILLADTLPGGIIPEFVKDTNTISSGKLYTRGGALYYRPATQNQKIYIFGHDRVAWIDWLGALFFIGVLGAVAAHGGWRFYAALRTPHAAPRTKKVYMYAVYERFWHWMQTFTIVLLLFTGLIIHRPDLFGIFSFRHIVTVHNVLAVILAINAVLSLFYHLASGEIRQYIPRPYGFFDQAIVQAKYYLRGIFKGGQHPFEKTPQKKLNPLQQITYFGILNILLPLQGLTGLLMWGVQRWPKLAGFFGGLPFLAPLHSLTAWLFAAFIVGHVYLTTTGPQPLTSIKAMMMGWEDVETHEKE